jgi:glycosyltransferase involved in cell wall biosynthesis
MQNVLFFLFRLHGGGAERVVSNLSMDLAEQYNIKIAVFDRSEQAYPYKGELIRIKLPFSGNTSENKLIARLIRLIVLVYKLKKLKTKHKIDVTISFAEQANIINILTKGKRKSILSVRTLLSKQISETPNAGIIRFLVKFLYNRADLIITPSKIAGQDLLEQFGVSPPLLKVISNYIDKEKIGNLSMERIDDSFHRQIFEQPIMLNVGRVTPAKGQWLLLAMMAKMKSAFPGWKLVIIGGSEKEGKLKSELIQLAEDLALKIYDSSGGQQRSLDFDIFLLGFQVNPFRYMRQSKVLLFPSVFEGFPNTVLEAMQSGLPVIVADCRSGPREILAPQTDLSIPTTKLELTKYGILCPALTNTEINEEVPSDILSEWIAAFSMVANQPGLINELIRNGYARVKEFDRKSILKQWRECIDQE